MSSPLPPGEGSDTIPWRRRATSTPARATGPRNTPVEDSDTGFLWSFVEGDDAPGPFAAGDLRPGSLFGDRFRVEGLLGKGGMGAVYRAHDQDANRTVAIKVQNQTSSGTEQLQRFQREGILTARLDHSGILKIHGGGVTNEGSSFLILELIEGAQTLTEFLVDHPEQGLDRLLEVAHAVAHAHRQGVIHRDLKPDNVLVDAHGRLRVSDFGLAWSSDADRLTQTNTMLGTPLFIAPEGFERGPGAIKATADVWALGVMLYEQLTGEPPFTATTLAELIVEIDSDQVTPPAEIDPSVSPALSHVCLRALAHDPAGRYPNAEGFADALEVALLGGSPRPSRSRVPLVVAAAAVLFALVLALLLTRQAPSGPTAATPTGTPQPGSSPEPASEAEAALAALLHRATTPAPLDPTIVNAFRDLAARASGTPAARRRVELERLRYLFRRGRWAQVLSELPPLEVGRGSLGAEATLLRAQVHYALRRVGERRLPRAAEPVQQRLSQPGTFGASARLTLQAYLALFQDDPKRAQELAQRAQELEPTRVSAILAEAIAQGRLKQLGAALACADRAITLEPDNALAHFLRAMGFAQGRRPAEAVVANRRGMFLVNPDPPPLMATNHLRMLANAKLFNEVVAVARALHDRNRSHPRWQWIQAYGMARVNKTKFTGQAKLRALHDADPRTFQSNLEGFVREQNRSVVLAWMAKPLQQIRAGAVYEEAVVAHDTQRLELARTLLEQSSAAGFPPAMSLLGESLLLGWGGPKNLERGVTALRRAAERGDTYGMFGLATCYQTGHGLPRDPAAAVKWLTRAVKGGSIRAMVNLGQVYYHGMGVPRDRPRALKLWTEAAQTGSSMALLNLGMFHANAKRPREALLWYRKALAAGGQQKEKSDIKTRAAIRRLLKRHPELR